MELSDAGIAFISRWEGRRPAWYQDVKGVWTIGIGHVWNPETDQDFAERELTEEEIDDLFRRDAARFIESVNTHVKVPLTQPQFDALVSFAFNWGIGNVSGFPKTTVLEAVNRRDHAAVAEELLKYDKGIPGVRNRRADEGRLYLSELHDGEEDDLTQEEHDTLVYTAQVLTEFKGFFGKLDPQGGNDYWRGMDEAVRLLKEAGKS